MPRVRTILAFGAAAAIAACSQDASTTAGPGEAPVVVLSVVPASSASAVNRSAPVVVTFSQAMMQGMEMNVILHEGAVTGAAIPSSASWSGDRRVLTVQPSAPLKATTGYVLHLAPTLTSAAGQQMNHGPCTTLGAQSVTSGMLGGSMMTGGSMGPGMAGSGWQMANGSYGMIFSFTTGS